MVIDYLYDSFGINMAVMLLTNNITKNNDYRL